MQHRHSVDHCLRNIMSAVDPSRSKHPFGVITFVFGGDIRQIFHVIPKASRGGGVFSAFNRSKLWDHCQVFLLQQNIQLTSRNFDQENKKIVEFSKWVLSVGNGQLPNINHVESTMILK